MPPTQEHPDPALVDFAGLAERFQYVGSKQLLQKRIFCAKNPRHRSTCFINHPALFFSAHLRDK
jgi:hypothetical protein